jgi:hypothetical protein
MDIEQFYEITIRFLTSNRYNVDKKKAKATIDSVIDFPEIFETQLRSPITPSVLARELAQPFFCIK